MSKKQVALVVGASGLAGNGIARYLSEHTDWQVLGMARNITSSMLPKDVQPICADLFCEQQVREALSDYSVTRVFYAAHYAGVEDQGRMPGSDLGWHLALNGLRWAKPLTHSMAKKYPERYYGRFSQRCSLAAETENKIMLANLLSALDGGGHVLQHFVMVTGGRYYGQHMGDLLHPGYSLPFVEDQHARIPGPNWYYVCEDYLRDYAQAKDWCWSILRPSALIGYAPNTYFNIGTSIAVYASMLKMMGLPLIFPATEPQFDCLAAYTHVDDLAALAVWASDSERAQNQCFNAASDQSVTWRQLWSDVMQRFDFHHMAMQHLAVVPLLQEQGPLWDATVARFNLRKNAYDKMIQPLFINQFLGMQWDSVYSNQKLRQAGAPELRSGRDVVLDHIDWLIKQRMVPDLREAQ